MDFTDYQFEGVRNFDSFIGMLFFVHSFLYFVFYSVLSLGFFFLVVQPPSLEGVCWNLLIASLVPARISDGGTRRFVYACYLDVDIVYNRSYIVCTGTRLPRSPPTSCSPRWSRIPDFNNGRLNKLEN